MALPKKGQMHQVIFPLVDSTDFATMESALTTASNFNSKIGNGSALLKFYGINTGVSTAMTSGAVSKAVVLVRSHLFAATLKGTENNYDNMTLMVTHPGAAVQLIQWSNRDVDESDIYSLLSDTKSNLESRIPKAVATNSQLSDLHSDLRSYLVGMSGALSDVESQLDLVPTVNNSDAISDIRSVLAGISDTLSKMGGPEHIASLVWDADKGSYVDASSMGSVLQAGNATASAIADKVWSDFQSKAGPSISNFVSNVSHMLSNMSDVLSDTLSAAQGVSDTLSKMGGPEHIASLVWDADKGSYVDASSMGSVLQAGTATPSAVADRVWSDFQSKVGRTISDAMSELFAISDTLSKMGGPEHIASLVWDADKGSYTDASSMGSVLQAGTATPSAVAAKVWSDFQSKAGPSISNFVSNVSHMLSNISGVLSDTLSSARGVSDTLSKMGGPEHIASLVWDADKGSYVDASSMGSVLQAGGATPSAVAAKVWSDFQSKAGPSISNFVSNVSHMLSNLSGVVSDLQSDFQSRVPKAVATNSQLSDLHSDLRSYLVGMSGAISDVESQVDLIPTVNNSNAISALQASVSDLHSDFQSRVPKAVATNSQLSDLHSDLLSYLTGMSGAISDVESQLDVGVDIREVFGDSQAASRLRAGASAMNVATVDTGSLAATASHFFVSTITEATASHFNDRTINFLSGALDGQACTISDYKLSGSYGKLTVTTLTETPANGQKFVIT